MVRKNPKLNSFYSSSLKARMDLKPNVGVKAKMTKITMIKNIKMTKKYLIQTGLFYFFV